MDRWRKEKKTEKVIERERKQGRRERKVERRRGKKKERRSVPKTKAGAVRDPENVKAAPKRANQYTKAKAVAQ